MSTIFEVIAVIKQTRADIMDFLQRNDPDTEKVVHPRSGWRVHDIITHLTWSDEQATAEINALLEDRVLVQPPHLQVCCPDDVHRRNAWIRRERYNYSPAKVMSDFKEAHETLKNALFRIGNNRLFKEFTASWGERVTPQDIAIWQIQHDQYHHRDLSKSMGCPQHLDNRVLGLIRTKM